MSKWLTYTPTTGRKNGTINVTASMNDTNSVRDNILNIFNTQYDVKKKVNFKQRSSAMPIILTLDTTNFTWEGGDFVVNVQCQGAWSLDAPVNITLDTYEGFGNASISGHLSYNFNSETIRLTIDGDSGKIYYDSVDLTESGLDTTNNTVYRYTAYKYAADPNVYYKGVNPNNHIWGDAYMEVVQAGLYKGYKDGVEIPFRHLTDQYTGDSAVIWDDIIDAVDIRYISLDGWYAEDMHYYNNTYVRRIDGISNLVILLPYHYEGYFSGGWMSTSGWRLEFAHMSDCEYADMKNLIPQDGWWDMGCMFQNFSGVLDCSTWSFTNISNMDSFCGKGALNLKSIERNGVRAVSNSMGSINLFGRVISANDLNPVRPNVFSSGDKVYYPDVYESEWTPYINYYTEVGFTPYNKDNFIISPDMSISTGYSKKISKIYPIFSSSDWTCRGDSSWFSVEKVLDLGYKIHFKENTDINNRVGHIYFTNNDGLTTIVEVTQSALFYIAYTTTDGEPLSFYVYNKNRGLLETYQILVDDEWRLCLSEETYPYYFEIYGFGSNETLKEFRGASTSCILRRLSFRDAKTLEQVNLRNITILFENYNQTVDIFRGCTQLKEIDWEGFARLSTESWDFSHLFDGCWNLEYADISGITLSAESYGRVTIDFSYMFNDCFALSEVKIGNITNRSIRANNMFMNCNRLTTVNAEYLIVDGDSHNMFNGCYELQEVTLRGGLTNKMYYDCWNLKNVTYLDTFEVSYIQSAFEKCYSLEEIDLSNVIFTNTKNINRLFYDCNRLNSVKFGIYAYFPYGKIKTKPLAEYGYFHLGDSYKNIFDHTSGGTIQIPTNAITTDRAGWDIRNEWDHFYPEEKWTVVKY